MGLFDWLDNIWQNILDFLNDAWSEVEKIEALKEVVRDDFKELVQTCKDLTQDTEDFKDRIENLRSHVIRADTVFELIEQIRTGEIKKFVVENMVQMESIYNSTLSEFASVLKDLQVFKSGPSALIDNIKKIYTVWVGIEKVVVLLNGVVPVLQDLQNRIERFESTIMPQTSQRNTLWVSPDKVKGAKRY